VNGLETDGEHPVTASMSHFPPHSGRKCDIVGVMAYRASSMMA